jgi:subtilisin family serine protease
MDPLSLVRLRSVMVVSSGNPDVTIGLIDGPIDLRHPAFEGSKIRAVKESQIAACKNASGMACKHGTFVAGILSYKREFSAAAAICPDCTLLLRPIFMDIELDVSKDYSNRNLVFPSTTPEELSEAIIEVVNAGADIINLSLGLSTSSLVSYPALSEAYEYARRHGTIIIAASGNQGNIGSISLMNNRWVIPVAACDDQGRLAPLSNFGRSIGHRGVLAPGINIMSTSHGGGYEKMSGTSFAAPFVTGAIALLWSIFPKATPADLFYAIRSSASSRPHKSVIPPLLNIEAAWTYLKNRIH